LVLWAHGFIDERLHWCLEGLIPYFDMLLFFDHYCGHRQWEDGLNVESISKEYGGKQSRLCSSKIKEVDGYLGSFNQRLNPGDTQIMVFGPNDDGTLWMTPTERGMRWIDTIIANKTVKRKNIQRKSWL